MPRNGRWSNSNSQKSHSDLVQQKSIMAPSKGNDFFRPSSWFSTTREGGCNTHTYCRLDKSSLCTEQHEGLKESTLASPLFKSFIPSIVLSDSGDSSVSIKTELAFVQYMEPCHSRHNKRQYRGRIKNIKLSIKATRRHNHKPFIKWYDFNVKTAQEEWNNQWW